MHRALRRGLCCLVGCLIATSALADGVIRGSLRFPIGSTAEPADLCASPLATQSEMTDDLRPCDGDDTQASMYAPPGYTMHLLTLRAVAYSDVIWQTNHCEIVVLIDGQPVAGTLTLADRYAFDTPHVPAGVPYEIAIGGPTGAVAPAGSRVSLSFDVAGLDGRACDVPTLAGLDVQIDYLLSDGSTAVGFGDRPEHWVMLIGSSNTGGAMSKPVGPSWLRTARESLGPDFVLYQRTCGGSRARDWAPATSAARCSSTDYRPEQIYDVRARSQLQSGTALVLVVDLGALDAISGQTVEEYDASMRNLTNGLLADCPTCAILLNKPYRFARMSLQQKALVVSYAPVVDAIVAADSSGRVFHGVDVDAVFGDDPVMFGRDGEHLSVTGASALAAAMSARLLELEGSLP